MWAEIASHFSCASAPSASETSDSNISPGCPPCGSVKGKVEQVHLVASMKTPPFRSQRHWVFDVTSCWRMHVASRSQGEERRRMSQEDADAPPGTSGTETTAADVSSRALTAAAVSSRAFFPLSEKPCKWNCTGFVVFLAFGCVGPPLGCVQRHLHL